MIFVYCIINFNYKKKTKQGDGVRVQLVGHRLARGSSGFNPSTQMVPQMPQVRSDS